MAQEWAENKRGGGDLGSSTFFCGRSTGRPNTSCWTRERHRETPRRAKPNSIEQQASKRNQERPEELETLANLTQEKAGNRTCGNGEKILGRKKDLRNGKYEREGAAWCSQDGCGIESFQGKSRVAALSLEISRYSVVADGDQPRTRCAYEGRGGEGVRGSPWWCARPGFWLAAAGSGVCGLRVVVVDYV